MSCEIVDTFPAFLTYWAGARDEPIDKQLERYVTDYLAPWRELLDKQIDDYASQNLHWRPIARERIFPHLTERLPDMREAHDKLLALCEPIYARAREVLAFDTTVVFVIYVGIGCGAGWATTFSGSPAILFGLENIAECGWTESNAIAGLIAHEIGHLVHHCWRVRHGNTIGHGPWWQLYQEGFAQYCEGLILDSDAWHQSSGDGGADWVDWCQSHIGLLSGEFLRRVDAQQPVSAFFGSWLQIHGRRETGCFLGYQAIKELSKRFAVHELALLENIEAYLRPVLEQMREFGG